MFDRGTHGVLDEIMQYAFEVASHKRTCADLRHNQMKNELIISARARGEIQQEFGVIGQDLISI
jgi:hypothetical protein